jgi:hypothetical protein
MSKTAVNWLEEQIKKHTWYDEEGFGYINVSSLDIEQAKEMEKKQIIDAVNDAWNMAKHSNFLNAQAEQYYNKTFK